MTAVKNFRVDSFVSGLAIKAPVRVATNAPITLSGTQTVNGVILQVGDRVLVKDQVDPIENGIYVCETSAWQRAGDWDGERDVVGGSLVPAYDVSGASFIHWIVDGTGERLSPSIDAMNFSLFYDPNASGGAVLPISNAINRTLRADGAGGWVEEPTVRITNLGGLSADGSVSIGDSDSVSFSYNSNILTTIGTGGFIHWAINTRVRWEQPFYMLERAAASADFTGYGQFWVRDSDGAPMFTTELGVDYQLNAAPSFTAPIVLLDDEQIQFGTSTDLTMDWDSAFGGFRITPLASGQIWAWEGQQKLRIYNALGLGYVQLENTGSLGTNNLVMSVGGGVSVIDYQVGAWQHNDNALYEPNLSDYTIAHSTAGSTSGVLNINFESGNSRFLTLTENITSVTFSNVPASGRLGQVEIEILQDSVARTITWPASVKWPGGAAPDLSTTNATYLVHLRTRDGGTTYLGSYLENFS